jgi:hypothetical protein
MNLGRIPGPLAFAAGVAGALYFGPRVLARLSDTPVPQAGDPADERELEGDAPASSSTTPEPAPAAFSFSEDVITPNLSGDPYSGAPYPQGGM